MTPKVVLFVLVATCCLIAAKAQYLGCCLDPNSTDLPFKMYVGNSNLNDVCSGWCAEAGYYYSGTQNGNECWCGNQYCTVGRLNDSSCNKHCSSVPYMTTVTCGGLGINSVSRTSATYLGCYADTEDRELAYDGPDTADPTTCMAFCGNAGYQFAGIQYWNQCRCGNSYGRYGRNTDPANDCARCGTQGWHMCGRGWTNAIYKI